MISPYFLLNTIFFSIRIQPISWRSWGQERTLCKYIHTNFLTLFYEYVIVQSKPPLTATSPQWPPLPFFGGQSIHWLLLKPVCNGHLSTTATFFCPLDGRCREAQLYYIFLTVSRSQFTLFLSCLMAYCYLGEGVSRPWEPGEEHPSWCPPILN